MDGAVLKAEPLGQDQSNIARNVGLQSGIANGLFSATRRLQSRQCTQERGLAAAVLPQHTNHLPTLQSKRKVSLHHVRAIPDTEVCALDSRH